MSDSLRNAHEKAQEREAQERKGPPARKGAKKAPSKAAEASAAPKIDFAADKQSASSDTFAEVGKMADRVDKIRAEIAEEQAYIKGLADELFRLETVALPETMKAAGLEMLRTESGLLVNIKPFIQANLPAAGTVDKATGEEKEELQKRLADGLSWLKENNGASIIKSEVIVSFGKGEEEIKTKFLDEIKDKGQPILDVEGVHPQTLLSFIKEKLAKGADVPFETFKIYSGEKAEVKSAKK